MRRDDERLKDIREAIIKIEKYTVRGKNIFFEDELIQTWVLFHLQTIGESASAMSKDFKARFPVVPWQDMSDFRNLIVHEYFRVNFKVVWQIVENDLPLLKQQIELILKGFKDF
jgi:uncharacterized protein with HEPN domain